MERNIFKRIIYFTFSFFTLFLFTNNVMAENVDPRPVLVAKDGINRLICLVDRIEVGANGTVYQVREKQANVSLPLITNSDVKGTDTQPAQCFCSNFNGSCTLKDRNQCSLPNRFTAVATDDSCAISEINNDGTGAYHFKYCLTGNNEDYKKAVSGLKNSMTTTMTSNGNYRVEMTIPNEYLKYANDIYVEYCAGDKCKVFSGNGLPTNVERTIRVSNGNKFIIDIPAGTNYYLVFKGRVDELCNSTYLGYYQGLTRNVVNNTLYNSDICVNVRTKYKDSWLKNLLPECQQETMSTAALTTFKNRIDKQWQLIQSISNNTINGDSNSTTSSTYNCAFDENLNKQTSTPVATYTTTIGKNNKYWAATCTENLYLEYDTPKAVEAGKGFEYEATIKTERVCTPVQLSKPTFKDTCAYGIECWGGPPKHEGDPGAGPNEEFDSCVKECDNGKYTQSCINSCYKSVYQSKNVSYDLSKSKTIFANSKNISSYNTMFLKTENIIGTTKGHGNNHTQNPVSSNCVVEGNSNSTYYAQGGAKECGIICSNEWCISEHGVKFTYTDGCNANQNSEATKCYEVYQSDSNCSTNPVLEYVTHLLESNTEYENIIKKIDSVDEDSKNKEKYSLSILERYGDNKTTTTIFDNTSKNNTIYSKEEDTSTVDNQGNRISIADITFSYDVVKNAKNLSLTNNAYNYLIDAIQKGLPADTHTVTRTINLKIGAGYITRDGSNAGKNSLTASSSVIYNRTNELTDKNKDNNSKFYGPYNQYFTSLDTTLGINNYKNWPYYNDNVPLSKSTDEYEKNINIELLNIGTWNQWGKVTNNSSSSIKINCFYGTTPNGFFCPPGDPDCPLTPTPTPSDELPPPSSSGLQYIFRPINLTDMFPNNRDPRFNWTGTIDKSTNKVTGAAILKENSFYSDAVDPETLISTIESKGESIYNVSTDSSEIDYEFVLTRENIRNIRSYNKNARDYNGDGEKNYLDYNMSCYTNSRGQQVCTSKFLDNIDGNSGAEGNSNFITYSVGGYGITERKSIAGCNNAINGTKCDTISK